MSRLSASPLACCTCNVPCRFFIIGVRRAFVQWLNVWCSNRGDCWFCICACDRFQATFWNVLNSAVHGCLKNVSNAKGWRWSMSLEGVATATAAAALWMAPWEVAAAAAVQSAALGRKQNQGLVWRGQAKWRESMPQHQLAFQRQVTLLRLLWDTTLWFNSSTYFQTVWNLWVICLKFVCNFSSQWLHWTIRFMIRQTVLLLLAETESWSPALQAPVNNKLHHANLLLSRLFPRRNLKLLQPSCWGLHSAYLRSRGVAAGCPARCSTYLLRRRCVCADQLAHAQQYALRLNVLNWLHYMWCSANRCEFACTSTCTAPPKQWNRLYFSSSCRGNFWERVLCILC